MAKGTVDWNSTETWQRVVAAMIAAGVKVDLKQTALYFGTTYDTLENRFRKVKKLSVTLKEEVENGSRGENTTPSRTKSAPSTPRKPKTPKKDPLSTVTNGGITKSTPKSKKNVIKQEVAEDSFSTALDDFADVGEMSFHDPTFAYSNEQAGENDDLMSFGV